MLNSNILFIQFYSYNEKFNRYDLGNGFSDTYDLCKNNGDMIWLNHNLPDNSKKKFGYNNNFIIDKGVVFINRSFQLNQKVELELTERYCNGDL